MKKIVLCWIALCSGIAAIYYARTESAEEEVAIADTSDEDTEPEKEEPIRYTNIQFNAIAEALRDNAVLEMFRLMKLEQVITPAQQIANLLDALEKFEINLRTAQIKSK